jgi:hypothetical protein
VELMKECNWDKSMKDELKGKAIKKGVRV